MIPGVPDCDFSRGEPPLTAEQIKKFAKSYEKYQFNDSEHELEFNGRKIGKPAHSFILPETTQMTLLNGATKSYPKGTWMLTTKVTDYDAVQTALNGGFTGYSPTIKNREVADRLASALKSEVITYSEFKGACKSHSRDGLIKDVVDPVVLSVSLTRKPCQHHSKFCKHDLGGNNVSEESTLNKIRKILGDSDPDDVSVLKSQVDTLEENVDKKFEELESSMKSSLKSMEEGFSEMLKEALKPVNASKSEDDDDVDDDSHKEDDDDTSQNNPSNNDEDDDDKGDTTQNKKSKGASKSRPLHNNSSSNTNGEKSTYIAMGRNPDGTAKTI